MTPLQRRAHLGAWCVLGAIVALTLAWSLALRERAPAAQGPAPGTGAQP